jgi:hypothetical protein
MKKLLLLCIGLALSVLSQAQTLPRFPQDWLGHWVGELSWYSANKPGVQKVKVQLIIQPADTTGHYTWQLIYGEKQEDNRPYVLKPVDASKGHWVVDERNGILLDQYSIGNVAVGAFSIQGATIMNSYQLEKDRMIMEFHSMLSQPIRQSGGGSTGVPPTDSYKVTSFQKAILKRKKK